MKILIIGINYAPELTGCGPYTADLAQQLMKDGHQVHVITGLPHYPSWKVPQSYRGKLQSTSEIDGVLVTRLWHWVPRKYSSLGRVIYEITFGLHCLFRVLPLRADMCIVVSPSLLSIFAGIWLKFRRGTLKILVQDLIAASARQHAKEFPKLFLNLVSSMEKFLLNKADSLGVINEGFISQLSNYGIPMSRIHVTPNYALFSTAKIFYNEARESFDWKSDEKIVLYTGSLGAKQNLQNLIRSASYLEKLNPHIKIVIVGEGPNKQELIALALNLSNVKFEDLVPAEIYSKLLAGADLLISHEGVSIDEAALPSKLTSYLQSGRPILVVASETSGAFRYALENQLPTCPPDQPKVLSEAINALMKGQHPAQKRTSKDLHARPIRISWASEPKR
jgi:glycosyltransferase involved in cell wall biosynthesis